MIKWFKTLLNVVSEYDVMVTHLQSVNTLQSKINIDHSNRLNEVSQAVHIAERARQDATQAVKFIKDRTEMHADVKVYGKQSSSVIIIGRYKGRDYVECFDVGNIEELVREMKDRQKHHGLRMVDAPPQFRAFIDHALGE